MKKALYIASVLAILLAFVACKPEPAPEPSALVGVWVNIDEDPVMMITTTLTFNENGSGSIRYDYTPIDEDNDVPEPVEVKINWIDSDGFLSLLFDTSRYKTLFPGGDDPAKFAYIGFEDNDLLDISYNKGDYLIMTRYEDCEVSKDGTEYTFVHENKIDNSTYTVVHTFDKTKGTMTEERKEEFHDNGSVSIIIRTWKMDETGAGENYTYRIWNDSLAFELKRNPYSLLEDGQKLVFRDEVFNKQQM